MQLYRFIMGQNIEFLSFFSFIKQMHEYFNRTFSEWNIKDFLDACDLQNFSQKIGIYLKSLEDISDSNKGRRGERAKKLFNIYKEES